MASIIVEGSVGTSTMRAEWRVYADQPYVDLHLNVHWLERFRVLKLVVPCACGHTRTDGIMGGHFRAEMTVPSALCAIGPSLATSLSLRPMSTG